MELKGTKRSLLELRRNTMPSAKFASKGFTLIASLLLLVLMSGLACALLMMVNTEQRAGGYDLNNTYTYRAGEGAMEKMTSDLANTFASIQAPSNTNICNSAVAPTIDPSVTFPLYTVGPAPGIPVAGGPCPPNPNPVPWGQIQTGTNAGLYAQLLPVVLNVTAQRADGQETVSFTRTSEVALIPVFQFGIFSDSDLFFGQSPNLGFAGRVHTNGDLYLGVANGDYLVFGDKLSAFGNVIREQMDDGMAVGGGLDDGTVLIPNASNGCNTQLNALQTGNPINASGTCINIAGTALGATNGSVVGGHGSGQNTGSWVNVSTATLASYLIDGNGVPPSANDGTNSTGATDLTLPFVQGTTSAIQIIRQPPPGESTASLLSQSRLANEAQIRVILSDTEDGLHLANWNGVPSEDYHLVSEVPTVLAALNQGADTATPGSTANAIQVNPSYAAGSGHYYSFGESWCTGLNLPVAAASSTFGPVATANYNTSYVDAGIFSTYNGTSTPLANGTLPVVPGHGCPATTKAGVMIGDGNFVIPPYYGGPGYSNATNNWPPSVYPQVPQTFPALVTGGAATFTTPNGGTGVVNNGLEWPLINGWLLVEYKNNAGVWVGVTNEWLQMGFARGVNVPTQAGFSCPGIATPNGTNTLKAANTGANPNGCNYLGDHKNAILYFEVTKDSALSGSPATGIGTVDQPLTANYYDSPQCGPPTTVLCKSQYNWYPINFYDAREGENYDALAAGNPLFPTSTGTPNGIMNAVELDVGNLRNWLLGNTGATGALVNYTAQNGYVLYFSDRRGEQFTNPAGVGQSQTQWGEYGFEDTVNFANIGANLKPDGNLDPLNYNGVSPEDVNGNSVLDKYGVFGVGDAWGPNTQQDTDGTFNPPSPYAQRLANGAERVPLTTVGLANRVTGARHVLKLVDGSLGNLPTMPAASGCTYLTSGVPNGTGCGGFTVASENPVYIQGNYNSNCAAAGNAGCTPFNATYDTTWTPATPANNEPNHSAAAILADAVTLLSTNWQDWGCQPAAAAGCNAALNTSTGSMVNPFLPSGEGAPPANPPSRIAVTTYYRTAIAGGKTIAFNNPGGNPDAYFGSDGGVHNFLRQLEDWFGVATQQQLYYKGSMVSLYWNTYATGTWKCCNLVYTPPDRRYVFDPLFTQFQNLPPATPMFRNVDNLSYRQNQVARTN
jgi:hypothetical protein